MNGGRQSLRHDVRYLTGGECGWMTVTQTNTEENAMNVRLFFVPVLLFALASSAFAQVDHPQIKNKPDAPLQITEAHCGQNPPRSYQPGTPAQETYYCHATLQFADTKDTWDGYGLTWILTYEDGNKSYNYQTSDNTNGTVGGDSTSRYKGMMARRRQAKEDPDNFWRKDEK